MSGFEVERDEEGAGDDGEGEQQPEEVKLKPEVEENVSGDAIVVARAGGEEAEEVRESGAATRGAGAGEERVPATQAAFGGEAAAAAAAATGGGASWVGTIAIDGVDQENEQQKSNVHPQRRKHTTSVAHCGEGGLLS